MLLVDQSDNTDELNTLLHEIQLLEDRLLSIVSEDTGPSETELRELDKKLTGKMQDLYAHKVESIDQLIIKTKFLLDRVGLFSEPGGMTKILTDKVYDELVDFAVQLRTKSSIDASGILQQASRSRPLIEVCYSSNARSALEVSQLEALCQSAAENNQRHGITGLLTYDHHAQKFYQILEGDQHSVWKLMSLIINDDRHKDVIVHHQTSISDRAFGTWSMRYLGLEEMSSCVHDIKDLDDWFEKLIFQGQRSNGQAWIAAVLKEMYSQGSPHKS